MLLDATGQGKTKYLLFNMEDNDSYYFGLSDILKSKSGIHRDQAGTQGD